MFACLLAIFIFTLFSQAPAHYLGWLPNKFYFLHPLGFVVATGSVLRPYGLSSAFWALTHFLKRGSAFRPLGLSATPGRRT